MQPEECCGHVHRSFKTIPGTVSTLLTMPYLIGSTPKATILYILTGPLEQINNSCLQMARQMSSSNDIFYLGYMLLWWSLDSVLAKSS